MSITRHQKRPLLETFLPLPWDFLLTFDTTDFSAATVYNEAILSRPFTTHGAPKRGVYNGKGYTTFDGDPTTPVYLDAAHAGWMEQQNGEGHTIAMLARLTSLAARQSGMHKGPAGARSWFADLAYGSGNAFIRYEVSAVGDTTQAVQANNALNQWVLYLFRFTPGAEIAAWGAGGVKNVNTTSIPSTLYVNTSGIAIGRINSSNAFPLFADVALAAKGPWMDDATINGLIYAARDNGMG